MAQNLDDDRFKGVTVREAIKTYCLGPGTPNSPSVVILLWKLLLEEDLQISWTLRLLILLN